MILHGLPWKGTKIILSFLRCISDLSTIKGYSIFSKGFLSIVVDIMVI